MANIKSTLPMFSQNWNTFYKHHVKCSSRTIPKIFLEPSNFFFVPMTKRSRREDKTKQKTRTRNFLLDISIYAEY